MRRARSVTGPLRRAHPASGATWNVQVVRGKMSSQCLWHACRALSAGLMLMLLGGAMATIGYYADQLSVAEEIRGNATVSVKDEARGFHLNNLSYAGPIVMGFGGFIVVAACVMTFEARDSAAKVTPARPTALPRPVARRGPPCAPARLDQLGVYRLPHVLPLPHQLPLVPPHHRHHHRPSHAARGAGERGSGGARFGSAPDLRSGSARAVSVSALRRPLRRYALSVDEPPHSAVSASAAESECGSQSSLALDLHGSGGGAGGGVTLRVRDNTRRRPLARQQRLRDDALHPTPGESRNDMNNIDESIHREIEEEVCKDITRSVRLSVENECGVRALDQEDISEPPSPPLLPPSSPPHLPPPSPRLVLTPSSPATSSISDTKILIASCSPSSSSITDAKILIACSPSSSSITDAKILIPPSSPTTSTNSDTKILIAPSPPTTLTIGDTKILIEPCSPSTSFITDTKILIEHPLDPQTPADQTCCKDSPSYSTIAEIIDPRPSENSPTKPDMDSCC